MNAKLVRNQLIAFVVVTVLGIGYAMSSYVGLPKLMGIGTYRVSVGLPSAGGLYANAAVTENGVTVGKVTGIHLTKQGVFADLNLNNGTKIPASGLKAAVANTSAVGEQYLNLTPQKSGGPYLAAGSVIPASNVTLPPDPTQSLADLNSLLASVPRAQLNTTINEMYNAFNGTGKDLRNLTSSSQQLLGAATQNLQPTKALIDESDPVLNTQAANSGNIKAFSQNLNAFTTQLRASNQDLTGSIDQSPGTLNQVDAMIGQLQPTVPLLLDNLTSLGQVSKVYLNNLQQSFVILPADLNDVNAAILNAPQSGEVNVDFKAQADTACTQGYSQKQRSPLDTSYQAAPNPAPYCTAPQSSQMQARGAHNDPCPNNPSVRSATAAGCGLDFGTTDSVDAKGSSSSGTTSATYQPGSGLFVGPGGTLYSAGQNTISGSGPKTFAGLLNETVNG